MLISIIIPVYNGVTTIIPLVRGLVNELTEQQLEIILVWDCGPEAGLNSCHELIKEFHKQVSVIELSRNFGEHNAVMCGLGYCNGDIAVIMDDDFQNPPSEVNKLVDEIAKGYDVVYGHYVEKQHSFFRNLGSWFNDKVATMLLRKPASLYLSSFKALNRFVIDKITSYNLPYPYVDGLILRVTNKYTSIFVQHCKRKEGKSGYTFRKLIHLWLNMFTNFSIMPLRIAMLAGLTSIGAAVAISLFVFYLTFIKHSSPAGWPTLMLSLTFFSGMQLLAIGMIGEYLGRLYLSHNGTPQSIVRKQHNPLFSEDNNDLQSSSKNNF